MYIPQWIVVVVLALGAGAAGSLVVTAIVDTEPSVRESTGPPGPAGPPGERGPAGPGTLIEHHAADSLSGDGTAVFPRPLDPGELASFVLNVRCEVAAVIALDVQGAGQGTVFVSSTNRAAFIARSLAVSSRIELGADFSGTRFEGTVEPVAGGTLQLALDAPDFCDSRWVDVVIWSSSADP